jgi:hypothetical protein
MSQPLVSPFLLLSVSPSLPFSHSFSKEGQVGYHIRENQEEFGR